MTEFYYNFVFDAWWYSSSFGSERKIMIAVITAKPLPYSNFTILYYFDTFAIYAITYIFHNNIKSEYIYNPNKP